MWQGFFLDRITTPTYNLFLAGLHVLGSSAGVAELSWACGRVIHHVFRVQISPQGALINDVKQILRISDPPNPSVTLKWLNYLQL